MKGKWGVEMHTSGIQEITYELKVLADELGGIAEAIHAVVGVDVTILDHRLVRLSGTGEFKRTLNCIIDDRSVFSKSLKDGTSQVVDDPRNNKACAACLNKSDCREFAHVCCPIIMDDGAIVGVIGLVAFSEEQRQRIRGSESYLIDFLEKMSSLIGTRLNAFKAQTAMLQQTAELAVLINALDHAVLSVDSRGVLRQWNKKAEELFGLERMRSYDIETLFEGAIPKEDRIHIPERFEVVMKRDGKAVRMFVESIPVFVSGKLDAHVVQIKETKSLLESAKPFLQDSRAITFDDILCSSAKMDLIKDYAGKASAARTSIMITGESGTGKELFARAIHASSPRNVHEFIAINCAAIPENLLESELFGYEEGTFTGARKGGKIGKLEMADNGTLFLDEIGDMPLHLQAKLLRFLQDGEIGRLGGLKTRKLDVRVISATHRPIEQMVQEGAFREDLYYRLNVVPLHVPPLRERIQDISILVPALVEKHCRRAGKSSLAVDAAVLECLSRYGWPGNVRELENSMEYAVTMASGPRILLEHLPKRIAGAHQKPIEESRHYESEVPSADVSMSIGIKRLDEIEKEMVAMALARYGMKGEGLQQAADALGVGRATLYRKLKIYGFSN